MAAGGAHADRVRPLQEIETFVVVAALLVAFWPVWLWYGERTLDSSDPSWGALALVLLTAICLRQPRCESSLDYRLPLAGVVTYLLTFTFTPPLVRATLAVLVFVSLVSQTRFGVNLKLPVLGLGLLALPVLASFQFYFGYPMRLVVSHASANLLGAGGLSVQAEGTGLLWMGKTVMVDAPCSGVNMLWVALLFACMIATVRSLSSLQTLGLVGLTIATTLVANILRACSLFYLEAGLVKAPGWAHSFVGLVCFAGLLLTIAHLSSSLSQPAALKSDQIASTRSHTWARKGLLPACLVASLLPLIGPTETPVQYNDFPGWPARFESKPLTRIDLLEQEEQFYKTGFPGKIARFSDGRREIVIRWVTQPTRALHPSQDCFRGTGYTVSSDRLKPGKREFLAEKGSRRLLVSEFITNDQGKVWTDVSSWYWDALLGWSEGPYWSYVVAEPCHTN